MSVRACLQLASPAGGRRRLSVLILHRVHAAADPLFPGEVERTRFDMICGWLRQWFRVLPLDQAVRRLRDGSLPARALAITFDDGYADNCEVALPVLQRHGLPATFFVATGFLDGGCMWNDRIIEAVRRTQRDSVDTPALGLAMPPLPLHTLGQRRLAIDSLIGALKYLAPDERHARVDALVAALQVALPTDLMMSSDQVRRLHRAGMQIGAHTVNHPILARLDADAACREIADSRHHLTTLIGAPVTLFAYPNGRPGEDYTDQSVEIVRDLGFEAAVSTAWGAARASTDVFQIPRFTPWDRSRTRFGLRMLTNLLH